MADDYIVVDGDHPGDGHHSIAKTCDKNISHIEIIIILICLPLTLLVQVYKTTFIIFISASQGMHE